MVRSLFVVGSQRSGTTMLLEALERSPEIEVHHENSGAVMREARLISLENLIAVLGRSRAKLFALKPLCDSHWIDRLLQHVDGSRAVWMFRGWTDVVNSATRKWPGHGLEVARRFRAGDRRWLDWRAERIEPRTRSAYDGMLELVNDDESARAAFWWLRNRIFFDRDLARQTAFIRPLRYESLVGEPARWLKGLMAFAGAGFDDRMATHIHSRSIARDEGPDIPAPIRTACDALLAELDRCASRAWD